MITKGKDYDSTKAFGTGGFKPLPKGGYICRISAAEEMTDKNGNPMVHIAFDIIDGEYTGYFTEQFRQRKLNNTDPMKKVKYPFEGQMWIPVHDYQDASKTSSKFKGLCTSLEHSGTQVWDERGNFLLVNLMNAEVGIVYQSVESEWQGNTRWRAVPWGCFSVADIESGEYFMPDDKPYVPKQNSGYNNYNAQVEDVDSFAMAESELPF